MAKIIEWTPEMLSVVRQVDLDWQQRISETFAEIDRIRADYERRLADERDKRYDERAHAQETAVNAALASQEKAVTAAFDAAKEAVTTATTELNDRLKLLNELRGNVLDRSAFEQFKQTYDERHQALINQISELRESIAVGPPGLHELQANDDQRMGAELGSTRTIDNRRAMWGIAIAVGALIVSAIGVSMTILILAISGHLN